jgi:hypothetical protein
MRLISAALLAAMTASPALASFWTYGDWRVSVTPQESEQDSYLNCRASTGGDGDPVLELNVFSGDGGPPYSYPMAVVVERAPRSYATAMQQGQPVDFVFDFDRSFAITATAASWFDQDGFAVADTNLRHEDHLPMLRAMKQGNWVEIWAGNTMLYEASLKGFTAAYGKMMDECGFSLELPAG